MAQNSRPAFRSPSLEQETVEELSRRLLEITAQLNASNRSLQHLQQERTEMLANLSHDLRAPLTAIRSAVDYLTSGQSLSAQDIEGALTLIDHRTATLEHLIRDMYELFTLEDPSHAFSFQELDAPAFLEEYFYTALPDSHYAGHLLCLSVPQDLHATLFADSGKLVRILDNLLGNAAKYAPAGTKITLSAAPSANRTYTVSSARTPGSATGSGLGLAIVKTITERHGGTVSCENAPGAGSIFSVTLPAKFLQS